MADDKEELPGFWKTVASHLQGLNKAVLALTAVLTALFTLWAVVKDHLPQPGQSSPIQTASAPTVTPPSSATPPVSASTSAAPSAASQTHAVREKHPESAGEAEQKAALAASRAAEVARKKQETARKKAASETRAREEAKAASEAEATLAAVKAASEAEARRRALAAPEVALGTKNGTPVQVTYWLEFAVYPTRDQARSAVAALAAKGIDALVINWLDTNSSTGNWYATRAGPYYDRSSMLSAQQRFDQLGLKTKEVVRQRPVSQTSSSAK
jgi:cell division protein FtsN